MHDQNIPRHTNVVTFMVKVPHDDELSEIRDWVQFQVHPRNLCVAANVQLDFKTMFWGDSNPDMSPSEFLDMLVSITPEALLSQFSQQNCFEFTKTVKKLLELRPELDAEIQAIPYCQSASRFGEQYYAIETASIHNLRKAISMGYPAIDDAIARIFVKYAIPELKEIYYGQN